MDLNLGLPFSLPQGSSLIKDATGAFIPRPANYEVHGQKLLSGGIYGLRSSPVHTGLGSFLSGLYLPREVEGKGPFLLLISAHYKKKNGDI